MVASTSTTSGGVIRTETLDFTSSTDTNDLTVMDIESKSRMYESNISLVQRYLYGQSKELDTMCAIAVTEEELKAILTRKAHAWTTTIKLVEVEKDLKLGSWLKYKLYLSVFLVVVPAVLMNLSDPIASLVGSFVFLSRFVLHALRWMGGRFRGGLHKDAKMYLRLLLEARSKAGSPQVAATPG